MRERPPENPRPTFLHHRGEFLQPKERVEPGVHRRARHRCPTDAPRDRLGFARWLVSPENPLTARVTVNRQWAAFFGRGLVRTPGDFGFQGEAPTHPELLDWLAVEFVQRGWSLKKLHRLIVMSATYRQIVARDAGTARARPENKLLARGPRVRLEAEMIRDARAARQRPALGERSAARACFRRSRKASREGAYGSPKWNVSAGEDRYRRGLYTFAKRTAPFAIYNTFDAPTGEACIARRDVSNTPLQALTLLNDLVFLEAAQALGETLAAQATRSRSASARSSAAASPARRRTTNSRADGILRHADAPVSTAANSTRKRSSAPTPPIPHEAAAWTALARALFNLDEAITRS